MGDNTLSPLEIWTSEYQEQNTLLAKKKDLKLLKAISKRENVNLDVIGEIIENNKIEVYTKKKKIVDLPLKPILESNYVKTYYLEELITINNVLEIPNINITNALFEVLLLPSVGSKRFLTNKADRSVTGLIAQQQCIGPLHTPLSDYAVIAQSHFGLTGGVVAIGEQPLKGLIDVEKMAKMCIGEMLTNIVWAKITCLEHIRCSGNWMWPANFKGEQYEIYKACKTMCDTVIKLGFAFDGGKDSLSMGYINHETNEQIKAPRSLVISGYAPINDITNKITAEFKNYNNDIIFIDLANKYQRLGGSAFAQILNQIGNKSPDLEDVHLLKNTFNKIQKLIYQKKILSGHDKSDGGLINTLCEMSIAGNLGCEIDISKIIYNYSKNANDNIINALFNEELGMVIEVKKKYTKQILEYFGEIAYLLGNVTNKDKIIIKNANQEIINEKMSHIRDIWEKTSFDLEMKQCNKNCVIEEKTGMKNRKNFKFCISSSIKKIINNYSRKYKIAIIRDEGSNGDREMAAAFYMAGFNVIDICINDFIQNNNLTLDSFQGIAFVGGFTYSDVFGAASGWYQIIKSNIKIKKEFENFYKRNDTFSLGICNGCQLMSLLGWIPKCKLIQNNSQRFESRFSYVKINKTSSIMLSGLENSYLGIWIAHLEGKFQFYDNPDMKLVPIQYVNDYYEPTTTYPFNPNGSPYGIAGYCSVNGRHLALMPHPERCFLKWQLPYLTKEIDKYNNLYSPWFTIFKNAYDWCSLHVN